MTKPVVAIVGRPNVGKSTLFNRILGRQAAVVDAEPGVTRDRLYQEVDWAGRRFVLVDTGGIESGAGEDMAGQVAGQARRAIAQAQLILYVLDGNAGLLEEDVQVAALLRRSGKPVLVVVNKVDDFNRPLPLGDFFRLGLGEPVPVSAAQGLNIGDLLDLVVAEMPPRADEPGGPLPVRIAVVGRPNVGKSSLVNAILGEDRVIVSDIPGTTRDAVDTLFRRDGREYVFIDTAGMRRKAKIRESIEHYSVLRAKKALERADLALVVLDFADGVTNQDQRIAGLAEEAGKGTIIVVNKWDLAEGTGVSAHRYQEEVRRELTFIGYAPVLCVSAVSGLGIPKILGSVETVMGEYRRQVPTSVLNRILHDAFMISPPPARKGKRLKLMYCTQVAAGPPAFLLFVNDPGLVSPGYRRYLENEVRRAMGFQGVPVRILFRRRESK
ncbi:MAG: ribosome biogenesis GTPase Der [Bacillota bacterium]